MHPYIVVPVVIVQQPCGGGGAGGGDCYDGSSSYKSCGLDRVQSRVAGWLIDSRGQEAWHKGTYILLNISPQ